MTMMIAGPRRDPPAEEPLPAAAQQPGISHRILWIGSALIAITLAGAFVAVLLLRENALRDARYAINATSVAIAEHTTRTVQAADLIVQELSERVAVVVGGRDLNDEDYLRSENFHLEMFAMPRNLPQIDGVGLIDSAGNLVNSSRGWPVPTINIADRDTFAYLRDHDDAAPFIGAPARNRASGLWTFFLARRVNGRGHNFAGIVIVTMPISYFDNFFQSVTQKENGVATLIRRDGILISHYPPLPASIGMKFPPYKQWPELVAAGGGDYLTPGTAELAPRLVSVRPLQLYPLVVDVAINKDAALQTWRGMAATIAAMAIAASAGFTWLFRLLHIQLRTVDQKRRALAATTGALARSEREATETANVLRTTLAFMDEGLMMVDSTGRVVVCNDRAVAMLNLPPALIASQPSFADVVKYQQESGEFNMPATPSLDAMERGGIEEGSNTYERQRPDGRTLEVRSSMLANGAMVRTYIDITARRAAETLIRQQATRDELTGLANRMVFHRQLQQAIDLSARSRRGFAVMYLDLDRFKQVNDTRGHLVGDKLLITVAQRITAAVRVTDTVARLGGDEFAIVQVLVDCQHEAATLAERLVHSVAQPYCIDEQRVEIGVSIGVALSPTDATSREQLLAFADKALYAAKNAGRSTFRFYAAVAAVATADADADAVG